MRNTGVRTFVVLAKVARFRAWDSGAIGKWKSRREFIGFLEAYLRNKKKGA